MSPSRRAAENVDGGNELSRDPRNLLMVRTAARRTQRMGPTPEQLYERMLVTRCQTGDERAFVELVERYQPRLAYFVLKLLGSARVEDVMQDVWLDVLRGLPALRDAGAFPAWVFRIARDRAYRELRRAGAVPTIVAIDVDAAVVDDAAQDDGFDEHDVALVHTCLDELSSQHREVLVLRFLQQMSYEDIAAVAGCDIGTVRSRLHYAKAALRKAMERKRST
jgi:RNA polymerase sigma-70 factor (ECF subfamily)